MIFESLFYLRIQIIIAAIYERLIEQTFFLFFVLHVRFNQNVLRITEPQVERLIDERNLKKYHRLFRTKIPACDFVRHLQKNPFQPICWII